MTTPTIASLMKEFADDAVKFAFDQYQVDLDYSEESIGQLENILINLYHDLQAAGPDEVSKQGVSKDETVNALCNMFGGYIGETIRRRYGGEWKAETRVSEEPMVCLEIGGTFIFPTSKVYKRLTNGSGDDVWFYYQVLKQRMQESLDD